MVNYNFEKGLYVFSKQVLCYLSYCTDVIFLYPQQITQERLNVQSNKCFN
jgi:hypothetical protein